MSAFGQIKTGYANDVMTTPSATVGVANTFDPVGYVLPGVAKWENRASGIAVGFPTLTLSTRQPNGSPMTKVQMRVSIPTVEQVAPSVIWTKAYESLFVGEFSLHQRTTQAERMELFDAVRSLFFATIQASDGAPSDSTGSPFLPAVKTYERPY
jgi:hypothetical protein